MEKLPKTKSDPEIKKIAMEVLDNLIFCDWMLKRHDRQRMGNFFLPLVLGGLDQVEVSNIGMIYEYYAASLPRSLNGKPIFTSMRMLTIEDTNKFRKYYKRFKEAKKKMLEGEEGESNPQPPDSQSGALTD